MEGTSLWRANLRDADLSCASLRRAKLDHADLSSANLHADLAGASLWGAQLSGTRFGHAVGITDGQLKKRASRLNVDGSSIPKFGVDNIDYPPNGM
jgi:uncharacterized protein YjbI with pentapeptide repeats